MSQSSTMIYFFIQKLTPHLQIEQNGANPCGFAHLQVVSEQGEARRALVVGWQHFDVDGCDGAPGKRIAKKKKNQTATTR